MFLARADLMFKEEEYSSSALVKGTRAVAHLINPVSFNLNIPGAPPSKFDLCHVSASATHR